MCRRVTLPAGTFRVAYDAMVSTSDDLDPFAPEAPEVPIAELPDDALLYTMPSRYCLSDELFYAAQDLFGSLPRGWSRVQAVCDWVHEHIEFGYGSSIASTTAKDVYESRKGVCRDFAHLAITFCRALNIPARYAFGYLPDIDVPPPYAEMDFCAWTEVFLAGRWWMFDPRNNVRRRGRVTIARGRDALDVAMVTTFGAVDLNNMTVRADRVGDDVRSLV
jgi:transglutaminase-like putative cysteine protease